MRNAAFFLLLGGCALEPVASDTAGPRQPTPVTALAFSADATLLYSGDPQGVVRVWDVASGRLLWTSDPVGASIIRLVIAADGSRAAALSGEERVFIVPLRESIAFREISAGHAIRTAAFLPDGSAIVTAGEGRRVECWNLATGEARWMIEESLFPVTQVLVSPDGASVACRVRGGKLSLRSVSDGSLRLTVPGVISPGTTVDFLPDSRLVVVGSIVAAFDAEGQRSKTLDPWEPTQVDWPRWMAPAVHLTSLRRRDSRERFVLLSDFDLMPPSPTPLILSRDGRLSATGDLSGKIQLFGEARRSAQLSGFSGKATRLAVSADGRYIAATGPNIRGIQVWRPDRPSEADWIPSRGLHFAFLNEDTLRTVAPGMRETWMISEVKDRLDFRDQGVEEGLMSRFVGISRDGRTAVAMDKDGIIHTWNGHEESLLHILPIRISELIPSSDGSAALAVLRQGTLIRITRGKTKLFPLKKEEVRMDSVSLNPRGDRALVPDRAGQALIIDLVTGETIRQLTADQDRISVAIFLNDGQNVLAGTERGRLLLIPPEGRPRALPAFHLGPVLALAVSPDDFAVVSSGDDAEVIYQLLSP